MTWDRSHSFSSLQPLISLWCQKTTTIDINRCLPHTKTYTSDSSTPTFNRFSEHNLGHISWRCGSSSFHPNHDEFSARSVKRIDSIHRHYMHAYTSVRVYRHYAVVQIDCLILCVIMYVVKSTSVPKHELVSWTLPYFRALVLCTLPPSEWFGRVRRGVIRHLVRSWALLVVSCHEINRGDCHLTISSQKHL